MTNATSLSEAAQTVIVKVFFDLTVRYAARSATQFKRGLILQALSTATKKDSSESTIFNVGQLLGLDWKLGVSLSASTCPKLQSPFVSLRMRTQDGSGTLQTKCLELTLDEFNVSNSTPYASTMHASLSVVVDLRLLRDCDFRICTRLCEMFPECWIAPRQFSFVFSLVHVYPHVDHSASLEHQV